MKREVRTKPIDVWRRMQVRPSLPPSLHNNATDVCVSAPCMSGKCCKG